MGVKKPIMQQGFRFALTGAARTVGFFSLALAMLPFHILPFFVRDMDRQCVPMLFHRGLVRLLGLKLRVHGVMSTAKPTLYVSNHTSYLDVPALGALIPAAFVAKSEVRRWPLIGGMARLQNTAFIERRVNRVSEQSGMLRKRLEANGNLILFPEGTSSDGSRTLPFKSSLFSIVESPLPDGSGIMVQPVTMLCTELGGLPIGRAWRPYFAWYGDMTLVPHLWNVFCLGHFTVDVIFHPPVRATAFASRKALADYCQRQIAQGVEQCVTGRFAQRLAPKKPLAEASADLAEIAP